MSHGWELLQLELLQGFSQEFGKVSGYQDTLYLTPKSFLIHSLSWVTLDNLTSLPVKQE